ncbi:MAG: hypothetical protein N4A49_09555 [Marinifilaceae bacterium]|jgi:Leucine-rich repeat (LRR) protein|nr:hypothetical protein [Marinifilaceae bacterium]
MIHEAIKKIESWNDSAIEEVIDLCKTNKELKENLINRYKDLLNTEKKSSSSLRGLLGLKAKWNKMNVPQRWELIQAWPKGVPFFTETVALEAKGSNAANHEEWKQNGIEHIGNEIGKLFNIKSLFLRNLPLKSISDYFGKLTQLEQLNIYNCGVCEYKDDIYCCDLKIPETIGNLKGLKTAFITLCGIQEIPSNIGRLENLTMLSISNAAIQSVPKELFEIKSLTNLNLKSNKYLNKLPKEILNSNLEYLDINGTGVGKNIEFLKELIVAKPDCKLNADAKDQIDFSQLINSSSTEKTSIDLFDKNLSQIPSSVLSNRQLVELNLASNKLENLPKEFVKLNKLEKLKLTSNPLAELPDFIKELKSLKVLNLESTKINKLPENINELINLEELILSSSKHIECLPKSFNQLKSLKKLDLSFTNIKEMPTDFENLKQLEYLELTSSLFNKYAQDLAKLPKLKTLHILSDDTSLSEHINSFKTLEHLNVSFGKYKIFPCTSNLEKLKSLTIIDTPISNLPDGMAALSNLTELTIEGSKLNALPADIYKLKNLVKLTLKSNAGITRLESDIKYLTKLETLNLSHTKLNEVSESIAELKNLKEFAIVGTKITKAVRKMSKLEKILSPDCKIKTSYV